MKEVLVTYMVIGDESNSSLTEMEPNFPYVLEPWAGRAAPRRAAAAINSWAPAPTFDDRRAPPLIICRRAADAMLVCLIIL